MGVHAGPGEVGGVLEQRVGAFLKQGHLGGDCQARAHTQQVVLLESAYFSAKDSTKEPARAPIPTLQGGGHRWPGCHAPREARLSV